MAGIFGLFNHEKEGPGVYADDPPRAPFINFFMILGRKFWKITTINLMYVLLSLPALALAFFMAPMFFRSLFPNMTFEFLVDVFQNSGVQLKEGISVGDFVYYQMTQGYFVVAFLLAGLGLVLVGPVHAGTSYVLRNYAREEHAFVWMDFREHAGKNWRQALVVSLISLLLIVLFIFNYAFYGNRELIGNDLLRVALKSLIIIALIIWCIMQFYIYPMMVTFELKTKELLKNSLLFSLIRLPLNLVILLCSILVTAVIPAILLFLGYGITFLVAIFWYAFFAPAFNLYMTTFVAWRGLERYMLRQVEQQQATTGDSSLEE